MKNKEELSMPFTYCREDWVDQLNDESFFGAEKDEEEPVDE